MTKQFCLDTLINPISQVVMILVVSTTLYLMSWNFLTHPRIIDPSPTIQQIKNTDQRVRIKTGLYVNNFLAFDLIKNNFVISGIVWFNFDKTKVSQAQLEQSVFSKGEAELQAVLADDAKPIVHEDGNVVYAKYPVQIKFMSNLNYKLFPFDSHRLYMTLNNMHFDNDKFLFEVDKDDFMLSKNIKTDGWLHTDKQVQSGETTKTISATKKTSYPRVIYAIDFVRNSFKDVILLIFPLLITLFMAMFTFSYDHQVYRTSILSVCTAAVGAMVGYRFVINNVAPKVPYFMLIDCLFNLFLIMAFTVFLINVFNLFKTCRGAVLLALHSILITSWWGLLYLWA
jgi:hypothetical protein